MRNGSGIPLKYKSQQRALFTLEKGIAGTKVFDDAIEAWENANSG